MSGKSRKHSTASLDASSRGEHLSAPEGALDGELLLESLFVDERPTSTPKFAQDAEDAEYSETRRGPDVPRTVAAEPRESFLARLRARLNARRSRKPGTRPVDSIEEPAVAVDEPLEPRETLETPESVEPREAKQEKPRKTPKARPSKRTAPRSSRRSVEHYLYAEIGGGRAVQWRLTSHGIEALDALPANAAAISFSGEDYRFETETRFNQRQAEQLVIQELGDVAQVINCSKNLGAVYATTQSRLHGLAHRLSPGPMAIDLLVQDRAKDAEALIVGLELKDGTGRDALLILYYRSAAGRLSPPQISVYPDNRDFLLSQFAATHQAAREDAQVLLLDHQALLESASQLLLYPFETMLGSIPVRQVWNCAAAASVLGAILSGAVAHHGFRANESTQAQLRSMQAQNETTERGTASRLEGSSRALAAALSIDTAAAFARSHAVWVPGSRVRLNTDGAATELLVTLPLISPRGGPQSTRLAPTDKRAVNTLLSLHAPVDCTRGSLNFTGSLNEAQLIIRCEATAHPLARYRSN